MEQRLHRSVTTNRKVSFVEAATVGRTAHPVMLRISKSDWVDLGRPNAVIVEVAKDEEMGTDNY